VSQLIYSQSPLATWVSYHRPAHLRGDGIKPKPPRPLKRNLGQNRKAEAGSPSSQRQFQAVHQLTVGMKRGELGKLALHIVRRMQQEPLVGL
jgi:hypothetical protein